MKIKRTMVGLLVMTLLIGTGFAPAISAQASTKVGTTTAKVRNTSVGANLTVSWTAVSDATGYDVYRSAVKYAGYKKVATTADTSYTTSKVLKNKTYYFKIKAFSTVDGQNVYGKYSKVVSGKTSKYPLYQVIDEGGQEVYFYYLWDVKNGWAEVDKYRSVYAKCEDILLARYEGKTTKPVGSSKKPGPTNYHFNGTGVSRSTPHVDFEE